MKKLPPFGKQLFTRIRSNLIKNVNIYTSWDMGKLLPHGITFPPDANPHEYDWTFLSGQQVSLINTNGAAEYEKLKKLAELLVKSGAESVGLIDPDHGLHWYLPERIEA